MEVTDYSGLLDAIPSYVNRFDLGSQTPVFISLGEAKFNRDLRTVDMQVCVKGNVAIGSTSIAFPADCLEIITLTLDCNAGHTVKFISMDEANKRRRYPNAYVFDPAYSIFGPNIELIGASSTTEQMPYTLKYYQKIPSLSNSNQTNWLLTKSPDLYVYAACLEAAVYLNDTEENIALWKSGYDMVINNMREQSNRALFPDGGFQIQYGTFG